jgi:hypothetical protein
MAFFPELAFANYVGPSERWFAWKPVELWSGAWIWMRFVERRVAVVHMRLEPGGGEKFWVYSRIPKNANH